MVRHPHAASRMADRPIVVGAQTTRERVEFRGGVWRGHDAFWRDELRDVFGTTESGGDGTGARETSALLCP